MLLMVLYGILVQFHVNRASWTFLGLVIGLFVVYNGCCRCGYPVL